MWCAFLLLYACACCGYFCFLFVIVVFFFKQKTAYEMRISDWSSDVCSSDLLSGFDGEGDGFDMLPSGAGMVGGTTSGMGVFAGQLGKIGRASCRERVCQYV